MTVAADVDTTLTARLRLVGAGAVTPMPDVTLHDLVRAQAERHPDRSAVRCGAESLTYRELDEWSDRVCRALTARAIEHGEAVGVLGEPGIAFVAGILGVVKAGCAYVPLDPAHGAGRLRSIIEQASIRYVVTDDQPPCVGVQQVQLSRPDASGPSPVGLNGSDLAYVIYTSGSTGEPKGVAVEHRGVINLIDDLHRRAPSTRGARRSWLTTAGFDASVVEIWPALTGGGEIVVVPAGVRRDPQRVVELLREECVVAAWLPAAFLPRLAKDAAEHGAEYRLRFLLVGAEPIPLGLLQDIIAAIPGLVVVNAYGPTESTVCATFAIVPATGGDRNRRTPIGEAVSNVRLYVDPVDEAHPLEGELYVAGVGVARGYLDRPDFTAERFLAEPAPQGPGRLYRTGDIVRVVANGELEYVARVDQQLKIRGCRVEPAEVERALTAEPGVRDALVVGRMVADATALVAYIVPQGTIDLAGLKRRLSDSLPDYMLPSALIVLDEVPLTPNGKVDRDALPAPNWGGDESDAVERPLVPIETTLATIWAGVLGIARVGVDDNFFELGGHSALAAEVVGRARETFDLDLPLLLLFEEPTIRGLAARIGMELRDRELAEAWQSFP